LYEVLQAAEAGSAGLCPAARSAAPAHPARLSPSGRRPRRCHPPTAARAGRTRGCKLGQDFSRVILRRTCAASRSHPTGWPACPTTSSPPTRSAMTWLVTLTTDYPDYVPVPHLRRGCRRPPRAGDRLPQPGLARERRRAARAAGHPARTRPTARLRRLARLRRRGEDGSVAGRGHRPSSSTASPMPPGFGGARPRRVTGANAPRPSGCHHHRRGRQCLLRRAHPPARTSTWTPSWCAATSGSRPSGPGCSKSPAGCSGSVTSRSRVAPVARGRGRLRRASRRRGCSVLWIYLDLHPREGKFKHAAQFDLVAGVEGHALPKVRWSATSRAGCSSTPTW